MAPQYANQQPEGYRNFVETVAIVGAGGQVGKVIAEALIKQGKHKVTAITRPDSKATLPEGLSHIEKVDYSSHESLVGALKGQDVLIITMAVTAPPNTQETLVNAAAEAGVKYVMLNQYGVDTSKEQLGKDIFLGPPAMAARAHAEKVGGDKMGWLGLACSFWYEFSLAGSEARYGFDFKEKKLTLFDDGNTKINTSTWPQCGRAVAKLLALPILPNDEADQTLCLSHWRNKAVYISSFYISQRDMLASVLRVTGDKESQWKITHEDSKTRYQRGVKMMQEGNMVGFGILLYTRVFFNDGSGDFREKLDNNKLGLPEEDLDEYTKVALEIAAKGVPY